MKNKVPSNTAIFEAFQKTAVAGSAKSQPLKKTSFEFKCLCDIVKWFCRKDVYVDEAVKAIRQIWMCAPLEPKVKLKPKLPSGAAGRSAPTFNKDKIMFHVATHTLDASELKKKFVYLGNIHTENGSIWTTLKNGQEGGTDLATYLRDLQHANYAFGPAKPNRCQSKVLLAQLDAVGLYKLLAEERTPSKSRPHSREA